MLIFFSPYRAAILDFRSLILMISLSFVVYLSHGVASFHSLSPSLSLALSVYHVFFFNVPSLLPCRFLITLSFFQFYLAVTLRLSPFHALCSSKRSHSFFANRSSCFPPCALLPSIPTYPDAYARSTFSISLSALQDLLQRQANLLRHTVGAAFEPGPNEPWNLVS